jgi:uncharacterized caspase-like protein
MSDRLALVIANSEYDDPKLARLETPSHDAEALAKVLRDPAIGGLEVTLLVNQAQRVVLEAIARLYQYKRKGDLLLLYYSGHGIKDEYGALYLAVKDTKTDIVSATAISAAFVRDQLDKSSSQRKVVVLDCCHSGAFARGAKALGGQRRHARGVCRQRLWPGDPDRQQRRRIRLGGGQAAGRGRKNVRVHPFPGARPADRRGRP